MHGFLDVVRNRRKGQTLLFRQKKTNHEASPVQVESVEVELNLVRPTEHCSNNLAASLLTGPAGATGGPSLKLESLGSGSLGVI